MKSENSSRKRGGLFIQGDGFVLERLMVHKTPFNASHVCSSLFCRQIYLPNQFPQESLNKFQALLVRLVCQAGNLFHGRLGVLWIDDRRRKVGYSLAWVVKTLCCMDLGWTYRGNLVDLNKNPNRDCCKVEGKIYCSSGKDQPRENDGFLRVDGHQETCVTSAWQGYWLSCSAWLECPSDSPDF